MIKCVFFDMNETLLDLELLEKKFKTYFNDSWALKYWFTKLLHTSAILASLDEYQDFGKIAEYTLSTLCKESNITLTQEVKDEILGSFRNLKAYDDVPKALTLLKDNNIRVIAVSNSSKQMIEEQLSNASILPYFDAYYSVDAVRRYKPFKDIYQYVAQQEQLAYEEIFMVATHDWDLFGAHKVGLHTAYIKRKETIFNPYYRQPDLKSSDLVALASQIIESKD